MNRYGYEFEPRYGLSEWLFPRGLRVTKRNMQLGVLTGIMILVLTISFVDIPSRPVSAKAQICGFME
jgi:hypothetical protein